MAKPVTIHTLDSLKENCIEIGECWIWQGYFHNGNPQVYHKDRVMSVRRVIHEILKGELPARHISVSTNCGEPGCVNPDHYVYRLPTQHLKYMASRVDSNSVERRMKLRESARKRGLFKLTEEQVKEILVSPLSGAELARRMNVNKSLVSSIRRGTARSINNQINNPFAGLMR